MANYLVECQLRIRNAADSADALVVTSVRGGTNPYLDGAPTGEGATLDPYSGKVTSGSITGRVIDPITSGTSRLFTSVIDDANFRPQFGQRKAYWEFRVDGGSWQTLYAGRLSRYALASDAAWEVTVSDWMRAEHEYAVFDLKDGETFDTYLSRWPNRGCILGGPILGGLAGFAGLDFNGWDFKVEEEGTNFSQSYVRLGLQRGYYPTGEPFTTLPDEVMRSINEAVDASSSVGRIRRSTEDTDLGALDLSMVSFPDIVVLVNRVSTTPRLAVFPIRLFTPGGFLWNFISPGPSFPNRPSIYLYGTAAGLGLTIGNTVKIDVLTKKISAASPVYWTGHPVDLLTKLADEASVPYKSSSATDTKNAVGASLRFTGRFDHSWNLGEIAEQAVYGPFGVGARGAEDLANAGKIEWFASRTFANAAPSTVISDADVVQDETAAYALDATQAVRRVVYEDIGLRRWQSMNRAQVFVEQPERFERDNADPDAIKTGEIAYSVPGMIHFADNNDGDLAKWVTARAAEIFDRRGRGEIGLETLLLRGGTGDGVKLGDEVLVSVKQVRNKNKRYGDDGTVGGRAMQVVHVTPLTIGKRVRLEDSGANANAIATAPTHTLAASTVNPRTVAAATITNAATLTASGYALRLQWAITTGAAPATTDYTDVKYYKAADIPTTAIGLPTVIAGRTVYVRGRSEKIGSRPSNWSTGVGVTLTAIDAPTGLTASSVTGDGSAEDLSWTNGTNAADNCMTTVWIRANGAAFGTAARYRNLLPGSNRVRVEGLAPNTAYTVSVEHFDPNTGDVSARTEANFTTANSTRTLNPPLSPIGWSGIPPSIPAMRMSSLQNEPGNAPTVQLTSAYGIAVMATEFPSFVAVEEAVETGVGAGTYGSFAEVGRPPAVGGDWTIWRGYAPIEGKRRKLRARHVRDGQTASSYTAEVVVDPGVAQPVAQPPAPQGTISISSSGRVKFSVDGAFSIGSYKYDKSTSSYPADATVASSGTAIDGRIQNDVDTGTDLTLGQRIYVTLIPFAGSNGTGVQGPSIHLTATRHDASATKTVYFGPNSFTPKSYQYGNIDHFVDYTNAYVRIINHAEGGSPAVVTLFDNFQVPEGCTITAVAADLYADSTTNSKAACAFYRTDSSGGRTSLGSDNTTATGWVTKTMSMSESTTARRYQMEIEFSSTLGTPGSSDARCAGFYITYTMPSSDKTL